MCQHSVVPVYRAATLSTLGQGCPRTEDKTQSSLAPAKRFWAAFTVLGTLGRRVGLMLIGTLSFMFLMFIGATARVALAQQVSVSVPATGVSESYFEYHGSSWTIIGPTGFARFGPPTSTPVPMPVVSGSGVRFSGRRIQGEFFGHWSSGMQRSHVSTTISEVLSEGYPGSIAWQSGRPFVTGVFPIVAGGQGIPANSVFLPWGLPPLVSPQPGLAFYPAHPTLSARLAPARIRPLARFDDPDVAKANNAANAVDLAGAAIADNDDRTPEGVPPAAEKRPHSGEQSDSPWVMRGPAARVDEPAGTNQHSHASLRDGQSTAEKVFLSVDQARAMREAELALNRQKAQDYLARAESAIAAGKWEVARSYLRLAEKYAGPELREIIGGKLAEVQTQAKTARQ